MRSVMQHLAVGAVLAVLMAAPVLAAEEDQGAQLYQQAQELLKKGQLEQAMKTFASAARADRSNAEYRQQYALMRRVIKLRDSLPKEQNPVKWQAGAQGMRTFYVRNGLYKEALPLEQQMHEKLNTAETARMVAETMLNLKKNAEAAAFIAGLDEAKKTAPGVVVLDGIAAARLDKKPQAEATLTALKVPGDAEPEMYMTVARLQALLGKNDAACASIVKALETTPSTKMAEPVAYAKACSDFAGIKESEAFAAALKTESKVKISGCSGGSDCGSCSMKGSCSK